MGKLQLSNDVVIKANPGFRVICPMSVLHSTVCLSLDTLLKCLVAAVEQCHSGPKGLS